MRNGRFQAREIVFKMRGTDGTICEFHVPEHNRVDPALKLQSDRRAKVMQANLAKAAAEAKRRGVPLHAILPVS